MFYHRILLWVLEQHLWRKYLMVSMLTGLWWFVHLIGLTLLEALEQSLMELHPEALVGLLFAVTYLHHLGMMAM